jgi:hypothetical protein
MIREFFVQRLHFSIVQLFRVAADIGLSLPDASKTDI